MLKLLEEVQMATQPVAAQGFTYNSLAFSRLRKNSCYLDENEEF